MGRSDTLCIYIQFSIIRREYECRVNLDNHFQDILEQLLILKGQDFRCMYQISDVPIIRCVDTNQYCLSNESLRTLRVKMCIRDRVSRADATLVKRLFEKEVPEIYQGVVEIKSIAREAGERTKMAVLSHNPDVDPIGSCIGPRGSRVQKIIDELDVYKRQPMHRAFFLCLRRR